MPIVAYLLRTIATLLVSTHSGSCYSMESKPGSTPTIYKRTREPLLRPLNILEFTVDAWCDCTENMYHVGEDVYLLEEKSTTGETGRINLNGVGLMTEKKRPCTLSRIKTNDCFEIPYCKLLGKCAVPHDDQPYTTRVQVGFNSAVPRCSAGYHCNPEPMGSTQSVLETLSI